MSAAGTDRWNRITAFVKSETEADGPLLPSTTLQTDLGIEGDDAFEFIEAFAEAFDVKTGDFDFHRYFGSEGFNPFTLIVGLFRRREKPVMVTLAMLDRAAERGVWQSADIEAA